MPLYLRTSSRHRKTYASGEVTHVFCLVGQVICRGQDRKVLGLGHGLATGLYGSASTPAWINTCVLFGQATIAPAPARRVCPAHRSAVRHLLEPMRWGRWRRSCRSWLALPVCGAVWLFRISLRGSVLLATCPELRPERSDDARTVLASRRRAPLWQWAPIGPAPRPPASRSAAPRPGGPAPSQVAVSSRGKGSVRFCEAEPPDDSYS